MAAKKKMFYVEVTTNFLICRILLAMHVVNLFSAEHILEYFLILRGMMIYSWQLWITIV